MKILEVGACSILDAPEFHKDVTKIYHNNVPKYGENLISWNDISSADYSSLIDCNDVIIISIGDKAERMYSFDTDLSDYKRKCRIYDSNFNKPYEFIMRVNEMAEPLFNESKLLIFFDSVCRFDGRYPGHIMYSVFKTAISKLLQEIDNERNLMYGTNNNLYILDLVLGQTTSRMCRKGQDPSLVRYQILEYISRFENGSDKLNTYELKYLNTYETEK